MIRILLVDDHPSVGEGTKLLLEQDPEIQVTALTLPMEALERLQIENFDLLLFDLNMPGISGLELTKRVISLDPENRILIYTGYDISPNFNILIDSGVTGFVSKTATREQLLTAIRCAMRDEAVIPVHLLRQLRRSEIHLSKRKDQTLNKVSITEREQEILQEVASGRSNKEIAAKLLMSQRTVEYSLTRVFEKLGVRSRSEAITEAMRIGLLRDNSIL
ncbi:response regulator transcription factor [Paenibacillus sp. UMB7766-LJ446]|jgi:two-component system competent response regulator ComA|uniref:response regulator transcription factor n=1 Tax=Paenibacillus TaxID=44249 RepID=UPI000BA0489B|nr:MULTISPECIES: response regulator transcription factor [Paenibacillus]MDK8192972.1 response regulator transcription factor [Paenibacillus sp. UMB7766-LJ446]MDN8592881.1 response regulator transcription factor [Paenibacillus sp. 11B]OZQ67373.1 DNA-binding response regulator [Paenibacillus taichungensis]HBU84676.1 DNA-binding response regulator [Paenibacillus sp.]